MALAVTGCLAFSSCSESQDDTVTYIPVQLSEGGAWVFIDENGERIGTQQWEFQPTVTYSEIFTARSDSGLTVYRWHGDEAKPVDSLSNLVSVGVLSEGLMPVTPPMQRIRVVDRDGDVKFTLDPIDGQEICSCSTTFHDGLLIVNTTNGKSGVVNTKGEVIVKPVYDDISDFSGGYALAMTYNPLDYEKGPNYFVIDNEGKVTPVKGKFGFNSEGDCFEISGFDHGVATVFGPWTSSVSDIPQILISTDAQTKTLKEATFITYLDNGSRIVYKYANDNTNTQWIGADEKVIMKGEPEEFFLEAGKYVGVAKSDSLIVYDDNGKRLFGINGNHTLEWPGGKFGPLISTFDVNTSSNTSALYDPTGQKVIHSYFGVGTTRTITVENEEIVCRELVTSAYVDITAATSRICQMTANGNLHGKKSYYVGQLISDMLEGENPNYYTYDTRSISIPTDSTGLLASGAGFWITGSAKSSHKIAEPTVEHYFEFDHFDYWGTAWGYNRTRQVGYHFNPSAKVESFDIQLRTNHPSGTALRQSIGRHLKTDGYSLVATEPNYDEYNNGSSTIIIYGNAESCGVGAVICNNSTHLPASEKAALVTNL